MNRNKELAKNTIIIAIGKICTQFVSFFLLPVYTHNLSTADYGTIDIILTCSSLIAPVLSLQLERATFRFLIDARKDHVEQGTILSTVFSTIALPIILTIILGPVIGLVFSLKYWEYITLILVAAIVSNVALQIPRGLGKNIHFSIGSMVVGIVNALTSIIAILVFHQGIEWVLIGNIISHALGFVYVFIAMKLYRQIKFSQRNRRTLKEMLKFSIPMIPNDISYWIINVSDRALIFAFLGGSANGIYAAATKIPALIITIWNIFNMSWMETVSAHANDPDASEYISKTANAILKLFSSICMGAIAMIPFIFNILIGQNFLESYQYIPILIIGSFFNIIVGMLSSVYIGYKKTKEIAKTTIAAAILNATINFALIRYIGTWAAVISTVLAYIFVSSYRLYDIGKTVRIRLDLKLIFLILCTFSISTVLYINESLLTNIINALFVLICAIILNGKLLISIVRKLEHPASLIHNLPTLPKHK